MCSVPCRKTGENGRIRLSDYCSEAIQRPMTGKREEELLALITSFNAARRKGALGFATSLAAELFPALCSKLKTFTANLFRQFNDTDCEDIVQEVMMDLIRDNYAKLSKTRSMSYLYSICYSRGRDFGRKKNRVVELDSIGEGDFQMELPAPDTINPDTVQITAERDETINRICSTYIPEAIKALPQSFRDIASLIFIDFAYQEDKISNEALFEMIHRRVPSADDAAEMDNLRQRKSRARRKLVDALKDKLKDDPVAWAVMVEFDSGCHK